MYLSNACNMPVINKNSPNQKWHNTNPKNIKSNTKATNKQTNMCFFMLHPCWTNNNYQPLRFRCFSAKSRQFCPHRQEGSHAPHQPLNLLHLSPLLPASATSALGGRPKPVTFWFRKAKEFFMWRIKEWMEIYSISWRGLVQMILLQNDLRLKDVEWFLGEPAINF